ncbi:GDSL esterase/lipase [Senna tora]|uniref:GDSL esterase/lipase n=1 Tax=Senna tora TaxID=362788 RepID=A0A834SM98_9FABA|nr:GDSL esterase/lipase [Senna tora]
MKIRSPIPYMQRDSVNKSMIAYGMNFGHGGTGVFKTLVDGPNLTTQIDFFQKLIEQNVYTKQDLKSSLALVNAASNDYATFAAKNGTFKDLPAFTTSLVGQISVDLRRIQSLGVSKIAIGLMAPLGCLPLLTVYSSYQKCIDEANTVSANHNKMMLQKVQDMNHQMGHPVFITLDLYNAFLSTITTMQKRHAENSTLMNPLEPCCVGSSAGYSCGSVDDKGVKKYKVCEKPELSFFWDIVHPSQNGWLGVYTALQSSLQQLSI